VIKAGLDANDQVVIGGIPVAVPGSKVAPQSGTISFNEAPTRG